MRPATILEQGDLVVSVARELLYLVVIRHQIILRYHPGFDRCLDLSDMVHRGVIAVDEHAGTGDGVIVDFAHVRSIGADQVDMLPRLQPRSFQGWLG